MIRRSEEKQSVRKPAPFNGVGEITVRSLLNGPEEMSQKGRVFGHTTVYPGSEIGYHIHTGDSETYYILSGKGLYNDNGTEVEIGAGDVTYCAPGEGHGLKCLGNEPAASRTALAGAASVLPERFLFFPQTDGGTWLGRIGQQILYLQFSSNASLQL